MSSYSIVLRDDEKNPLIEISSKDSQDSWNYTQLPHLDCLKNFASVAFQAAPSLLTQAKVVNSSIMEVVVNGDLIKAADGNGFRASVKGPDGKFIENARLFEPESLSNLVNAAAVWQIASVVVAQKHLADISQKLDELKGGINRIQNFQQKERQTKVHAISNFLKEKVSLLMTDERHHGTRDLLISDINNYYVELDQIFLHLKDDLITYGLKKTEHKEMFGSADFQTGMDEKIEEIHKYIELSYLCLDLKSTCIAISDYLNEPNSLVEYRFNTVFKEIESLHLLVQQVRQSIIEEVRQLKSYTNQLQSKISNNKRNIAKAAAVGVGVIAGPIGLVASSVLAATAAAAGTVLKDQPKTEILEKRKQNMIANISRCLAYSMEHAEQSKKLTNITINSLVQSSQPIKLAFKKINDDHVLCLNTNETILISA